MQKAKNIDPVNPKTVDGFLQSMIRQYRSHTIMYPDAILLVVWSAFDTSSKTRLLCKVILDTIGLGLYPITVIRSFKNRALKKLWTKNDASGIRPDWTVKVRIVLSRLDVATEPKEMNGAGFGFHALAGNLDGRFAVTVSKNWRITFGWSGQDAIDVDLEDYHGK